MPGLLRSLSQRFRRSTKRDGDAAASGGQPLAPATRPESTTDPRRQCHCKVMLLDGTDLNIALSKRALGGDVYEQVFYALDLEERDYFGLQFMDHYHVQHWLDPAKKLSKQVPIGPPYTFRFRVKFYSSEPNNLREELTRYQFFLQLKQDVLSGKLECPRDVAIELAAFALQSELGDFNPVEHSPAFVSEFRFHPEQDEDMELQILEKFKECRGQSPATAELNYLNKAKWLELYGVDMHVVQGKDSNQYRLGLTPTGMLVFDGNQKIGLFFWPKIQKLSFKNRKLTLVVEEDEDPQNNGQVQLHTFVFHLTSHKASKHLWKCAIEHHSFFRLTSHHAQRHARGQLFRLGSTFRYRGRTEYENVHKDGGRLSRRSSNTFERRPSQRYGPRQSHLTKRQQFRQDLKQQTVASLMPEQQPVCSSVASGHSSPLGSRPSPIGSSNTSTGTHKENIHISPKQHKIAAAEARLDNLIFANASTIPNGTDKHTKSNGHVSEVPVLNGSPSFRRPFHYHSASNLQHNGVRPAPCSALPLHFADPLNHHNGRASAPLRPSERIYDTPLAAADAPHVTTIAISDRGSQIHTSRLPDDRTRLISSPIPIEHHKNGHITASSRIPKYIVASSPTQNGGGEEEQKPVVSSSESTVSTPTVIQPESGRVGEQMVYFGMDKKNGVSEEMPAREGETFSRPSKLPVKSASALTPTKTGNNQGEMSSQSSHHVSSSRIPKSSAAVYRLPHQHLAQTPVLQSAYSNSAFKHDQRGNSVPYHIPIIRTGMPANTQSRVITEL